jgi:hypothetical protein
VVILALSGCPLSVYDVNRLPPSQPLGEPVLFNAPGPLRHDPSGLTFPESYGQFQRVTAYRYDTAGLDVSVGYNDREADCLIVATFHVYPTPRMTFIGASPATVNSIEGGWLQREYLRSKADLQQHHPRMETQSESGATTPARGTVLGGISLVFKDDTDISEIRLFVYDHKWFLKYRLSYPESCRAQAQDRIRELVERLPWTTA